MKATILLLVVALVVAFANVVLARSNVDARAVLEYSSPIIVPPGWKRAPMLHHEHLAVEKELLFAIKQSSTKEFEELFWKVSNPKNKDYYGRYLTLDEITSMIAPHQASLEKIQTWILESTSLKLDRISRHRDFASLRLPLSVIERLFQCKFEAFEHESGKRHITSLGPYSVPHGLAPHLDFVAGIVDFPRIWNHRQRYHVGVNGNPTADKTITPVQIRARYNVSNEIVTHPNSSSAVAEFGDNFSPKDLKTFFAKFVTDGQQFDTIAKVVGPNAPSQPGDEASLDVQYIMGVAPNASTWYIQFNTEHFWNDFASWVEYLGSTEGVPFVHSVSWGSSQFAGGFPSNAYRMRLETELQKVGLRGISVLIASGDNGVGCDNNKCKFLDDYPAESQYVTAVGATGFIAGNTGDERAVNYPGEFTSGGGFSWLFTRPDYQNASVNQYLATVSSLPPAGSFNPNGRGTADVAALGSIEFQVVIDGAVSSIGGTSASCPTFAGIVTLLNDVRLNNNQPTLGFLNPLLYQINEENPEAFFDVTVGNNNWPCDCSSQNGFNCATGWDPATGVGTPNFAVLKKEILKSFAKN